jgi:hypothetical protein
MTRVGGAFGMPRYKVAHIKEQGQQMIIIPLESAFGHKGSSDQQQEYNEFQMRATAAGLEGTVALVWDAGGSQMGFLAPDVWRPYFSSINLFFVTSNVNRELSWH